ncbi:MAG: D-alanine--D-alanine ligase [Alphaproteobacteria bacterium]|nr:D-alanine--D-alanine ligase [Alphaproteobacteria bacterium]
MEKELLLNVINNLNDISKNAKIAVICGGKSRERKVSLKSGENCYEALKGLGYYNSFIVDLKGDYKSELKCFEIDIAFLALHGTYGEDGYIQSILENIGIPYTGSGVLASSLCMNKEKTKKHLNKAGVLVPKSYSDSSQINYPVFCKPIDQGSSLASGVANNKQELQTILKEVENCNSKPIIEELLIGRELTVGVLQLNNHIFATDILEVEVKNGNYDYNNKYTEGALIHTSPANIDSFISNEIKSIAVKAFKELSCSGFSRVDFILTEEGRFYVLEVNTLPGMTNTSDLPCQSKSFGINKRNLVNLMLHSALLNKA